MRIWGDRNDKSTNTNTTVPPVTPPSAAVVSTTPSPTELSKGVDWERFEARWKQEDEHWERYVLTGQLSEALSRMGDANNPVMRIYGARCLADLALRVANGTTGALMSERYPFFAPAANCLAAAVPLEEHPAVRYEIRVALDALIQFGRDGGQHMLYILIQALAEANRAALRAFTDALGRYLAKHGAEERALPPLLGFLPFSTNKEATLHCLHTLAQEPEVEALRDRQAALRIAQATFGEPAASGNNTLIDTLAVRGARLIDARDALANALHAITPPPSDTEASARAFEEWRNARRLYLYGVFLVGARLCGAQLPGSVLAKAHLEGANLEGTNLIAADLSQSFLFGAELYNVAFDDKQRPQLRANLRDAAWWHATPNSWRGVPGQAVFKWLEVNYPQPEPEPLSPDLNDDENDTGLTDEMLAKIHGSHFAVAADPAPAAPVGVGANGVNQSAADKIAEIKRRASGNGKGEPTSNFVLAAGAVVEREKGVPSVKERVSPRDLGDVADLMNGNGSAIRNGASVQMRDKGRGKHTDVTSSDLLAVTDLMKDR